MCRRFLFLTLAAFLLLGLQSSHAEQQKQVQVDRQELNRTTRKLAEAMSNKDEAAVRLFAAKSTSILGELAGVPEIPDEFRQPPEQVEPLTKNEADLGFAKILQVVRKNRWWRLGLDPAKVQHLPREVATCMNGCLAGCRVNASNSEDLLKEAVEAGEYLLWTQRQAGTGVIPFPAYRGGENQAFQAADRFLQKAERDGRIHEVVKNGWAFEDLTDGGLQFDNGECGVALFALYESTSEKRFLDGAIRSADWTLDRPCVPNWNYNSFSVHLLATAYRITREPKYLKAAKEKARLGLIPGQLRDGPHRGRWADRHNARPAYHYIMIRGLLSLFSVLPIEDRDREPIASSIRAAMQARNIEFTSQGIANVDSALEAILLFKSLSSEQQQEIGNCHADAALDVLERHCVSRLRRNEAPFSAGVGGAYFALVRSSPHGTGNR